MDQYKYYWLVPVCLMVGAIGASLTGSIVGIGFGTALTILAAMEWRAYFVLRSIRRKRD